MVNPVIVYKPKRALILKVRDTERITNVIPTAKVIDYKGTSLVAVPHRLDETKVLRNLGINAPSPIKHYYNWSGQYSPFYAQSETADFLTLHGSAFVLNDLGTGKTMSALWAYDFLKSEGRANKMLVISPLSTLERTWGDEIFTHFPHLTFAVLHGTRDRRFKLLAQDVDIYLINHDGVKTTGFAEAMAKRPDIDIVLVDEIAQMARNAQADRWKVLNTICNKQHPRLIWGMTGTPTPNAPTDAWAQCRIVRPGGVPPYFKRFREQVMRQIGTHSWVARDTASDIVEDVMQPAVRFTRDECVDLPPCIYETRSVELMPEQQKAYKDMLSKLVTEIDGEQITAVNEAVKISKLLQIVCGVAYGANHEEVTLPSTNRLNAVTEAIEEASTKVIVFVPFVSAVEVVAKHVRHWMDKADFTTKELDPKQPSVVEVIHGGVSKHERDSIFQAFQKGGLTKVLVAQPAAMSHGLTLTAASTIIWYAPITSNDTYEQANGRITRPGQKHTQVIINIEGSAVERRLYTRLKNKQAMQGILLDLVKARRDT